MLHYSGRFTALLDANVLYPAALRDHLMWLSIKGVYTAKWSATIWEEVQRNLLAKRQELKREDLARTFRLMNEALPDAMVDTPLFLSDKITLPDPGDHHVLASAIYGHASIIVTENIKDFPSDILKPFNVEAVTPDQFVKQLIDLDQNACRQALSDQVSMLRNPPQSMEAVLSTLEKQGLRAPVTMYRQLINKKVYK